MVGKQSFAGEYRKDKETRGLQSDPPEVSPTARPAPWNLVIIGPSRSKRVFRGEQSQRMH